MVFFFLLLFLLFGCCCCRVGWVWLGWVDCNAAPISSPFLIIRYCAITWWARQCWMEFGVTLINIIVFFFFFLRFFFRVFGSGLVWVHFYRARSVWEGNFILPLIWKWFLTRKRENKVSRRICLFFFFVLIFVDLNDEVTV